VPYRGVTTRLSFDRYRTEIVAQTDLVRSTAAGAEPTAPVPTCPGWNLGQLLRHLGGAADVLPAREPARILLVAAGA
jgi:hypothetical protein